MNNWPNDISEYDLGNRKLSIIPTPGHQNQAIIIYDAHTKWLLTRDSFYPGQIYIKDWQDYKLSI
ncbi:MAG: MBL fold metallo-hydrolase, partial [Crocinitomicaceae bacterium]|nr:MBL fold metallo-hydrolase [Crocinitomicaceae bacterium]